MSSHVCALNDDELARLRALNAALAAGELSTDRAEELSGLLCKVSDANPDEQQTATTAAMVEMLAALTKAMRPEAPDIGTCADCRFFTARKDIHGEEGPHIRLDGQCRRYPPTTATANYGGSSQTYTYLEWPYTRGNAFCGEYTARHTPHGT